MDNYGQRPPRQPRPGASTGYSHPQSPSSPSYPEQPPISYNGFSRPPLQPNAGAVPNVSFQDSERGERTDPLEHPGRQRTAPSAYTNITSPDPENGFQLGDTAMVGRKKSLVRPDREKIEPGHRQWHYRNHAAQLEDDGVIPSSAYFLLTSCVHCVEYVA